MRCESNLRRFCRQDWEIAQPEKTAALVRGISQSDWSEKNKAGMFSIGDDDRLNSIVQHQIGQQFCSYRKLSVVVDQSHRSEFIHEVGDARTGSADHFRKGFMTQHGDTRSNLPRWRTGEPSKSPI